METRKKPKRDYAALHTTGDLQVHPPTQQPIAVLLQPVNIPPEHIVNIPGQADNSLEQPQQPIEAAA